MWSPSLAGPPCRSVSVCRERGAQDNGPRRVRDRQGPGRFGRADLSEQEANLVLGDNVLCLRTLWLVVCAAYVNPRCESTIEQPRDPAEWKSGDGSQFPSFLAWPETQKAAEIARLKKRTFDQGSLGLTWPKDLSRRIQFSRSLAAWAPGLKAAFASMLHRVFQEMSQESGCCNGLGCLEVSRVQWPPSIQEGLCSLCGKHG